MADEGSCARGRDLDRHETELRDLRHEVRTEYVRKDVYQAALDRLAVVEAKLATTWLSNRNALLAMGSMIVGIGVAAYLGTKGGGQ